MAGGSHQRAPLSHTPQRQQRRTLPIPRRRLRSTIPPAHPRIRIIRRGLPAVPVLTRLPGRTLLPAIPLLPTLTLRALNAGLTLNTLRAGRTSGPRRADRAGNAGRTARPGPPRRTVLARIPRRSRRTRLALRTRGSRRPRHTHPRLTSTTGRPGHRGGAKPLDLLDQRVRTGLLPPQIVGQIHDQNGEGRQQHQRQHARHRAQPFRARQPYRPPLLPGPGHFATTAQIAIAADSNPISTGTIIWYNRA
jgi:hypothetical protein